MGKREVEEREMEREGGGGERKMERWVQGEKERD